MNLRATWLLSEGQDFEMYRDLEATSGALIFQPLSLVKDEPVTILPLHAVPPVFFSEVLRDVSLFMTARVSA